MADDMDPSSPDILTSGLVIPSGSSSSGGPGGNNLVTGLDLAVSRSNLSNNSCNLLSPLVVVGCSSIQQQQQQNFTNLFMDGADLFFNGSFTTINGTNFTNGITSGLPDTLPNPDIVPLTFTQMSTTSRNCVIAYIILFLISATGNLSVFFSVIQQLRKSKSRICVLILHLSLADLMVTFFVMPIEVVWRFTVGWYGGNILCKICQFLRAFGLYLSSMVLICISLDRYFAIIHPLRTSGAKRRGRAMLSCAWISAAICSLPQSVIFHVQHHPLYPKFRQCVSFDYFVSDQDERAYNIASVTIMYFLPLIVIIFTYGRILYKIFRKSRQHQQVMKSCKNLGEATGRILLRRSDATNNLERAKNRTLRLTLVIVIVFVLCWSPYIVMLFWYMVDRDGAQKVDKNVQEALFIMAVANSCVNPLVYGTYTRECRDTVTHCCLTDSTRRRNLHRPSSRHSKCTISSRVMSTALETTSPSCTTGRSTRYSVKGLGGGRPLSILESDQHQQQQQQQAVTCQCALGCHDRGRENRKKESIIVVFTFQHKEPTVVTTATTTTTAAAVDNSAPLQKCMQYPWVGGDADEL